MSILGGDYAAALEADGVSLPSGKLPESDELEGWVASTRRLLAAARAEAEAVLSRPRPPPAPPRGCVSAPHHHCPPSRRQAGESPSLAEGVLPPADARAIRQLLAAPRATPAARGPSPRERAPPAEVAKGEGAPLDSLCRKEEQEARLAPASVLVGPVHATVDSARSQSRLREEAQAARLTSPRPVASCRLQRGWRHWRRGWRSALRAEGASAAPCRLDARACVKVPRSHVERGVCADLSHERYRPRRAYPLQNPREKHDPPKAKKKKAHRGPRAFYWILRAPRRGPAGRGVYEHYEHCQCSVSLTLCGLFARYANGLMRVAMS